VDVPRFLADGSAEEINKHPFEAEAWLSSVLKLWHVTMGQELHSIEGSLGWSTRWHSRRTESRSCSPAGRWWR
jgi:hypothetical protein